MSDRPQNLLDRREHFSSLMQCVIAGSEEAARELVATYGPELRRLVRRRLHKKLRSKFDSLDFLQDVWASFFARLPEGSRFDHPSDLAAFLTCLARNRVADVARQRLAGHKYNVRREEPLLDSAGEELPTLPAARQPTPSTVAISREEWERLMKREPPVYQKILQLLREGLTVAEIAREVPVGERQVRRVIKRVFPGLFR